MDVLMVWTLRGLQDSSILHFCRLSKKTAHAKSWVGKHVVLASRVCMSTCQPLADVLKGIKQHWATVLGAWPLLDLAPSCPLVCQTGMVEVQGAIKACLLAELFPRPSYALQSLQCSILFLVNLWQQHAIQGIPQHTNESFCCSTFWGTRI